jgi:hypothetical protein
MSNIPQLLHAPVQHVIEWRRKIAQRNGTDDARRAQAARLFVQQAGPPVGRLFDTTTGTCTRQRNG